MYIFRHIICTEQFPITCVNNSTRQIHLGSFIIILWGCRDQTAEGRELKLRLWTTINAAMTWLLLDWEIKRFMYKRGMEKILGCLIPFTPLISEWHLIPTISLILCQNVISKSRLPLLFGFFRHKLKPQAVLSQPEIIPVWSYF